MIKKNVYYLLLAINVLILFAVIFSEYELIASVIGIILLVITYFISLKITRNKSNYSSITLAPYKVDFAGVDSIVFGIIGLSSMMKITEAYDLTWFYYLMFNLFILAQASIKVNRI